MGQLRSPEKQHRWGPLQRFWVRGGVLWWTLVRMRRYRRGDRFGRAEEATQAWQRVDLG